MTILVCICCCSAKQDDTQQQLLPGVASLIRRMDAAYGTGGAVQTSASHEPPPHNNSSNNERQGSLSSDVDEYQSDSGSETEFAGAEQGSDKSGAEFLTPPAPSSQNTHGQTSGDQHVLRNRASQKSAATSRCADVPDASTLRCPSAASSRRFSNDVFLTYCEESPSDCAVARQLKAALENREGCRPRLFSQGDEGLKVYDVVRDLSIGEPEVHLVSAAARSAAFVVILSPAYCHDAITRRLHFPQVPVLAVFIYQFFFNRLLFACLFFMCLCLFACL